MITLIISSLLIQIYTLVRTTQYNYYKQLDFDIYVFSMFDVVTTSFFIYIVWLCLGEKINRGVRKWKEIAQMSKPLELITFLLMIYTVYLAYKSINLIFLGATRQALITEHNMFNISYIIVSSYFKVLFPAFLITNISYKIKLMLLVGFIGSMLVTASRNELIYAGYLIATIYLIFDFKKGVKIVSISLFSFMSLAFFLTILQGRPVGDGFSAVFGVFDKHILYRSYALYLSERVTELNLDTDKVIYPFFGYISDKILSELSLVDYSIDNSFVSHYEYLGYDLHTGNYYYANVLYPWWSWFLLSFGMFGFIIKGIFVFLLLYLSARFGCIVTFLYGTSIILFSSPFYTPLITIGGVISFIITITLDFYLKNTRCI